ncbi:MAG: flavin reductase family protein [Clostridia bacterium]|nr:flavin reductase family protein [Clostridia bacterium]
MNQNTKLKWKGGTLLAPLPAVMVSCGTMDKPNIITIGWTGIINSDPAKTYISIRPSRYSYELVKKAGKFVINLATEDLARATDYCGVRSGRDENKFEKCSLTAVPAHELEDTPVIAESPISLECRVTDIVPLGTHDMFVADVVAVDVAPSLFDEKGALHLELAKLIAYSHGDYFALGRKLGDFGYSVRKKSTVKRRAAQKKHTQNSKRRPAPKKKHQ